MDYPPLRIMTKGAEMIKKILTTLSNMKRKFNTMIVVMLVFGG
jgi:hypothetical protein